MINVRQQLEFLKFKSNYAKYKNRKEGPIIPTVKAGIRNAIQNRWKIYIYYIGDEESKPGGRWAEPYVYGRSVFTFNHLLRAYSYEGASVSGKPGWRTFRLDRIRSLAVLSSKTFDKPKAGYTGGTDMLMDTIYQFVTFPNTIAPG